MAEFKTASSLHKNRRSHSLSGFFVLGNGAKNGW